MAKDAKGHGSEKRGGGPTPDGGHGVSAQFIKNFVAARQPAVQWLASMQDNAGAAKALAAPGNPKSVAAPVHPDAAGRADAAGSPRYPGSGTGPGGIGERKLTSRKI